MLPQSVPGRVGRADNLAGINPPVWFRYCAIRLCRWPLGPTQGLCPAGGVNPGGSL